MRIYFFSILTCDDILMKLSASLAVAKALRHVVEGKASAQAEAAEWKRKFELEKSRNLQLERKGSLHAHKTCFNLIIFTF